MAQRTPFFEMFSNFSPEFSVRVLLNSAFVTGVTVEKERRAMTIDLDVRGELEDAARTLVEQLLAQQYG